MGCSHAGCTAVGRRCCGLRSLGAGLGKELGKEPVAAVPLLARLISAKVAGPWLGWLRAKVATWGCVYHVGMSGACSSEHLLCAVLVQ